MTHDVDLEVPMQEDQSVSIDAEVQCNLVFEDEKQELKITLSQMERELRKRNEDIYILRQENEGLKKRIFGFESIKKSDNFISFFTGVASLSVFLWIGKVLKSKLQKVTSSISFEDHILLVMMKLRLGLLNRDLAYRFGIEETTVSKIYRRWLQGMAAGMKNLLIWPSRSEVRLNLPNSFKKKYRDCVCTIQYPRPRFCGGVWGETRGERFLRSSFRSGVRTEKVDLVIYLEFVFLLFSSGVVCYHGNSFLKSSLQVPC